MCLVESQLGEYLQTIFQSDEKTLFAKHLKYNYYAFDQNNNMLVNAKKSTVVN